MTIDKESKEIKEYKPQFPKENPPIDQIKVEECICIDHDKFPCNPNCQLCKIKNENKTN